MKRIQEAEKREEFENCKKAFLQELCAERPIKLVLSNPINQTQEFRKIIFQLMEVRNHCLNGNHLGINNWNLG